MADTFPLLLPARPAVRRIVLTPQPIVGVSESPFTGDAQVYVHQGQLWQAEVELPPIVGTARAGPWKAFLTKLNGRAGTFLMGDPDARVPRGSAANEPGLPQVQGDGQLGSDLLIDGLPASVSGYLLAGDYVQLGSGPDARLHLVQDDVDSDPAGQATLSLWPRVRRSPPDNDTVVVAQTQGVFRMTSNATGWESNEAMVYGFSFTARSVP